jgi:hypothetical protein
MDKIILIFSISAAGFVLSEAIIALWLELYKKMPIKPFSCGYCLSFWIGLYVFFEPTYNCLLLACLCAVINSFIFKQLNK